VLGENRSVLKKINELKPNGKDELLKYCKLPKIESILPRELSEQLLLQEESRVEIEYNGKNHTLISFCQWISSWKGSKVVVLNTVRNAALIADYLDKMGMEVFHLSTALTPKDRKNILEKVKIKLYNRENCCLIATSCIESGVDISFQWGFRECSSLDSVLQLSGRVNRRKEFTETGLQVFELLKNDKHGGEFTNNPMYDRSSLVLRSFFKQNKISPRFSVEFFNKCFLLPEFNLPELERNLVFKDNISKSSSKDEEGNSVHKFYKVIAEEKKTVIINEDELDEDVSKHIILANSVQIYEANLEKLMANKTIQESQKFPGLHKWNGAYDNFIGYQRHFMN
jgi:CRISPR/Cas system-associated endonuclease/helicase Cas3